MERLTAEEQDLVARAWCIAGTVIREHRRERPGPEYDGFVAERLCRAASRRDPTGDLGAWAAGLAWHACLDARRDNATAGFVRAKRVVRRRPRVSRLSELEAKGGSDRDDRHRDAVGAWIPSRDEPPEWERREAFDALLSGLGDDARAVLTALYWGGMKQREVAAAVGLSPSRVSHIHADALAALRSRAVG